MIFYFIIGALLNIDRTNWRSILLCFVAAVIFWIFNALNKDYTTNLRFPVEFNFDRNRYTPVESLPDAILISVRGNGWAILRRSLNLYSKDIMIPLKDPTKVKRIVGKTLPALLTNQMQGLQVNYVITDTLHLNIDAWKTRKIKMVIAAEKFSYAKNFGKIGKVRIAPDSVQIKGPQSTVNALPDSIVINASDDNLDSDFKERIKINFEGQKYLEYTPSVVEVSFNVVKWKKINQIVKLNIINVPSDIQLDIIRDSINCVLQIPEEKIENFMQDQQKIIAIIDAEKLNNAGEKILPQVMDLPNYVQLVEIDSVAIQLY